MNKILYITIFVILLAPMIASSYALQEVAGKIIVQTKPGGTQNFRWGLLSDNNATITVALSAVGNGSEFLSFLNSVNLEPKQILYVTVNASIPSSYNGKSVLTPLLFATQAGKKGGATVLNVAVEKLVTLNITGTNPIAQGTVPEFPSIAVMLFTVATMSAIIVMAARKNHNLFRL